ncbi:Sulfotransferase family protein [Pseudoxanthomonas sp. GM95]|uniref:tetratricopeptide repeat-containing sulfotransferase family protein n=1 Tax=Pseudoxanthomonas sp. GM95 TaxID=1881043 RepID=UPI0008AACB08|nr:sulfotransferase [Pseudoxanthomonas sp. GM95]SEL44312.1 Sulfotransferase family protein [Pseudoxanthomonas sp. GM95]
MQALIPPSSDAFAQQARALAARGHWPQLADLCARWLQASPGQAQAHLLAGIAALEQRQLASSLRHLAQATTLAPGDGEAAAEHARALSLAQHQASSLVEARRGLPLCAGDARALGLLGVVFSRASDHVAASAAFAQACALRPDDAGLQYNLAASRKFLGEFDGARAAYEACVALQPTHWRAQSALSLLGKPTTERNRIATLKALLPQAERDTLGSLHVHHALSRQYEGLGDFDAAWQHLLESKRVHRAQLGDVAARDAALFDALIAAFPTPLPASSPDAPIQAPIFIIGMPRSGTTLVDRILSSHPQLESAGELQNFGVALKRASGSATRHLLDADTLARTAQMDWPRLGRDYLAGVQPLLQDGAPRFTDKLPHNFLYAGHIARALPGARIVCLRRDPLDVCIGNLRTLFAVNTPYFHYASDPLDTARYVLQFQRLMAHWQRVLPDRILELDYEALVDDQEGQTRKLLAFCGLPWDPACLAFEHNPAPVATASATQVREPLHRQGIGRWRRYAAHLGPMRAVLGV